MPSPAGGLDDPAWAETLGAEAADEHVSTASMGPEAKLGRAAAGRAYLHFRAGRLWSNDYTVWLQRECEEVPALRASVVEMTTVQVSTWRLRLKEPEAIAAYDHKTERIVRDTTAQMRRRRNMFDIPFSVDARTMSYFNQRVPTRVWLENQAAMRILHRQSAKVVLNAMMEIQPKPPFITNGFVACFCVDQCNHWEASAFSKKGQFRGNERLDKLGMPVVIRSETVLNVVEKHLPFTSPMLTPDEVKLIRDNGPYTEDKNKLFKALDPKLLEKEQWNMVCFMLSLLMLNVPPPLLPQLPKSEQEITDKILGKPSVKPAGPSHIKIHKPIPKCETQSYSDAFKTMAYLSGLVPAQYGRRASKSSRSVHDARRTAACALRGPLAARPAREHPLQLL